MKYYSEDEMREIRAAFEGHVLSWPEVTTKKMFGCPCYQANKKLFAFLVIGGVVITKLSEPDRQSLSNDFQTVPFQAGKKTVKNWPRVSIQDKAELNTIISYVEKSYDTALNE